MYYDGDDVTNEMTMRNEMMTRELQFFFFSPLVFVFFESEKKNLSSPRRRPFTGSTCGPARRPFVGGRADGVLCRAATISGTTVQGPVTVGIERIARRESWIQVGSNAHGCASDCGDGG